MNSSKRKKAPFSSSFKFVKHSFTSVIFLFLAGLRGLILLSGWTILIRENGKVPMIPRVTWKRPKQVNCQLIQGGKIKLLQELRFLKSQVLLKSRPRAFLQNKALSLTPFCADRPFPLRAVSAYRLDPVAQLNYITLSKHPSSNAPPSSVNSRPFGRPVDADVCRGELTFARTICKWQAVSAMGNENAASSGDEIFEQLRLAIPFRLR